jgi:type I restriction enzyme S subunit
MQSNQSQKNTSKNWQLRKLDSMFTVRRGGSPRPIESYITNRDDGLNWLKIGDIDVGAKYITGTSSKILKEGLSRTTLVKKGDFILSNSMSFGRPYIMNIDACIHDGWLTFQDIKTDILDRDFLYYLLSQSKTQSIFASISAGSGVLNLKKETVAEVELSIPPLSEQYRIVSILETWDKSIGSLSEKINLKEQIKRSLMQDLLTGKKRLGGFSDKWESTKLGKIASFKKGKGLSKSELDSGGKYEAIHYGELFTKYNEYIENIISRTNSNKNMFLSKKNDILMPTSDVTPRGLSTASYIDKDGVILGGDILVIRSTGNLHGLFFCYLVNLNKKEVIKLVSGSTVFHLYGSDMAKFELKLPSLKEQESIVKILVTADKEITELEKKLSILKEQKRYLLNNLITGTIRTPETLSTKITK